MPDVQTYHGDPTGVVKPNFPGQLLTDTATPALWQSSGTGLSDWAKTGQGGSSVPGATIVRKFPFAFDTPAILTGAALYTPTIGDVLLDAWIEKDTAWDGTTPLGDIGQFLSGGHVGWFGNQDGAIDMTDLDAIDKLGSDSILSQNAAPSSLLSQNIISGTSPLTALVRLVPGKFTAADPIKVVVSQNGNNNGADPGSTQGAGVLYLVTSTPA
jgi:hypothetical protein